MIVAYRLSIDDDDSHFLGDESFRPPQSAGFHDWRFGRAEHPHPATCPTCGRKTDPDFINPSFRVKRRRRDIVATADGYCLASERFRRYCASQPWEGVKFLPLPADPDFFVFRPTLVLPFDAARRGTRFENPCPTCREYYNVIGATPVYLVGIERIQDGLYRTDLEFGSGPEQQPVTLAGISSGEELRKQKFTGLTLCPVAT
ncbi:MAG: hypothetical protein JWP89_4780 [Schlesneria sp.]|nr:hypothetical protein [Schlesneria sp.]